MVASSFMQGGKSEEGRATLEGRLVVFRAGTCWSLERGVLTLKLDLFGA